MLNELTVVTDEMVRWDFESAPTLELRRVLHGISNVGSLTILAFLPAGFDGDPVDILTSVGGVPRQVSFLSTRDFLNAFELELEPVELNGQQYSVGRMVFPSADFPDPIVLAGGEDFFRVTYASPPLDNPDAVVYLRALR
jgi:hypothetical protein